MKIRTSSIAGRITLVAAILITLILVAGGAALSLIVRDFVVRAFEQRLVETLELVIASSEVNRGTGELTVQRGAFFQPGIDIAGDTAPDLRPYWQIGPLSEPDRALLPGGLIESHMWASNWTLPIPQDIGGDRYYRSDQVGPQGETLRVFGRMIRLGGAAQPLPFLVAGDLKAVDQQMLRLNGVLVAAFGLLGLCLLALVFAQIRFGLRPLRTVSSSIGRIRSGESERLDGTFPREISGLTNELNTLLDHNRTMIRRAREQVEDMAHVIKTPLAVLKNESDRKEPLDASLVGEQLDTIRAHVDRYVMRTRIAATKDLLGARVAVRPVAAALTNALTRLYADKNLALTLDCPETLFFKGEGEDLNEALGNLADNACKWSAGQVRISAHALDDDLCILVEDDGPGLPSDKRAEVLERGRRLDATVPGSGLGLPIAQEIADAYGGTLTLGASGLGGLKAELRLPSADT